MLSDSNELSYELSASVKMLFFGNTKIKRSKCEHKKSIESVKLEFFKLNRMAEADDFFALLQTALISLLLIKGIGLQIQNPVV